MGSLLVEAPDHVWGVWVPAAHVPGLTRDLNERVTHG